MSIDQAHRSEEVLGQHVIGGRPPVPEPVLHVHTDGIQVLPAPAMEPDHLPLGRRRREEAACFITKRTVLAPVGDEREGPQDTGPFPSVSVVVAVDACQHLVGVVKFNLKIHSKYVKCKWVMCSCVLRNLILHSPCGLCGRYSHA
jgi:hypothetical protein